jgi:hypothetical protein
MNDHMPLKAGSLRKGRCDIAEDQGIEILIGLIARYRRVTAARWIEMVLSDIGYSRGKPEIEPLNRLKKPLGVIRRFQIAAPWCW